MDIKWVRVLAAGGFLAMVPLAAQADVIFTAISNAGGINRSANADFNISGGTLTITLQNTSTANTLETPTSTLTGIRFTLGGSAPTLTPASAISPNAIVLPSACNANPCGGTNVNVGGEWGYDKFGGTTEEVGSAGYVTTGLPGDLGNFNGVDLETPPSLDGIEFGILSATHGTLNGGNGGLITQAMIDDKVVLTLSGVPGGDTNASIGNVTFLYGTAPDATLGGSVCTSNCGGSNGHGSGSGQAAPEPTSLALIGSALLGLGAAIRRRRKTH